MFIVFYLLDSFRMERTRMGQCLSLLVCVLLLLKAEGISVPITYVETAVAKGAGEDFCYVFALHLQHHYFK